MLCFSALWTIRKKEYKQSSLIDLRHPYINCLNTKSGFPVGWLLFCHQIQVGMFVCMWKRHTTRWSRLTLRWKAAFMLMLKEKHNGTAGRQQILFMFRVTKDIFHIRHTHICTFLQHDWRRICCDIALTERIWIGATFLPERQLRCSSSTDTITGSHGNILTFNCHLRRSKQKQHISNYH